MPKEKPLKDNYPHGESYQILVPKEEINSMVRKELNKLYPDYTETSRLRKEIFNLHIRLRKIENSLIPE